MEQEEFDFCDRCGRYLVPGEVCACADPVEVVEYPALSLEVEAQIAEFERKYGLV